MPSSHLQIAKWLGILILLTVAAGWRPRCTALPHWWVAFSVQVSATIPDGGDQVTALLTLLMIPVALTDNRRWHWSIPRGYNSLPSTSLEGSRRLIATMTFWLIRLQVAAIYFDAFVGKLKVQEWANGTVLYYWFTDPSFGPPHWLNPLLTWLTTTPLLVAVMTWGTLILEFSLSLGLIAPRSARRYLLIAGIMFHSLIAVTMGLISFGLAMFGALLLYLRPVDQPISLSKLSILPAKLGLFRGQKAKLETQFQSKRVP